MAARTRVETLAEPFSLDIAIADISDIQRSKAAP